MNRIEKRLKKLAAEGTPAFIPFIMAGDPTLEQSGAIACELARVGADIVEFGVPFSDPVADGVVNQEAALRALHNNVTLRDIIGLIEKLRNSTQVPLMLFTYFNPVLTYGIPKFAADAAAAGVDGVLCVDLPPEEAAEYKACLDEKGIATVFLVAPTSTPERIEMIAKASTGFIYYVSRTGVTGERENVEASVSKMVAEIRRHSDKPVAVGFGISKPEHAAEVAGYADGVVVGSAIVRMVGELRSHPDLVSKVGAFVKTLVDATRKGAG